jgi:hypothetical protein
MISGIGYYADVTPRRLVLSISSLIESKITHLEIKYSTFLPKNGGTVSQSVTVALGLISFRNVEILGFLRQ